MTSLRDELAYDLHVWTHKTVPRVIAAVIVGLALTAAAAFWIMSYASDQTRERADAAYDTVPTTAFAAGVVEVFACINDGPTCAQYSEAIQFVRTNPARDLVYTPASAADPGKVNGDGTHVLACDGGTSEADIRAVAAAVTGGGQVGRVDPSAFTDSADGGVAGMRVDTATVMVDGRPTHLRIRFTVSDAATLALYEITRS